MACHAAGRATRNTPRSTSAELDAEVIDGRLKAPRRRHSTANEAEGGRRGRSGAAVRDPVRILGLLRYATPDVGALQRRGGPRGRSAAARSWAGGAPPFPFTRPSSSWGDGAGGRSASGSSAGCSSGSSRAACFGAGICPLLASAVRRQGPNPLRRFSSTGLRARLGTVCSVFFRACGSWGLGVGMAAEKWRGRETAPAVGRPVAALAAAIFFKRRSPSSSTRSRNRSFALLKEIGELRDGEPPSRGSRPTSSFAFVILWADPHAHALIAR